MVTSRVDAWEPGGEEVCVERVLFHLSVGPYLSRFGPGGARVVLYLSIWSWRRVVLVRLAVVAPSPCEYRVS